MLEYRTATAYSVQQRELVIRVAPYGEVADFPGGYRERYQRGQLQIPANVALKLETGPNHEGRVIGRAVGWEDRPDGLYGTFKVSEVDDGNDALILARDEAVGASIGFMPDVRAMAESIGPDGVATAVGEIREVTLTGTPVYQLAQVAEVRSLSRQEDAMTDEATTPSVDDARLAELETRATAAEKALDDLRRAAADDATPPPDTDPKGEQLPQVAGKSRGWQWRSAGHLMVDVAAGLRKGDSDALERLGKLIDERMIVPTAKGHDISVRAFATPAVPGVDDNTPNAYVPDMLDLIYQGRAFSAGFAAGNLDQYYGSAVDMPAVTQGSLVDYHQPAGTVASQNVVSSPVTFPKAVLAGGQGYAWETAQWSSPGYVGTLIRDLLGAYGEKVEFESINGVEAVGPPVEINGALNVGTDVPAATDDMAGLIKAVGTAVANHMTKSPTGVGQMPSAIAMSPKAWGWAIGETDTTGRPLVTQEAPQNPVGIGSARAVGTFRSLPVIVSAEIPVNLGVGTDETPVIVTSFRDANLLESAGAPAQISLSYPDSLTTDLTAFGAIASAIRRPATFQVISGFTAT